MSADLPDPPREFVLLKQSVYAAQAGLELMIFPPLPLLANLPACATTTSCKWLCLENPDFRGIGEIY